MENGVIENHKKYLERVAFYRRFGYDLEKERDFILDCCEPISGQILEIGTGKGHFAVALGKRGFSFTSIDISPQEQGIALLNIKYFGLEKQAALKIENAECLSFPDASFDNIFSVNVFHHLRNPQAVLNEMLRVSKPSGKLVISDFNDEGLKIINECHKKEGRKHDHSLHGLDEAKRFFLEKGYSVREAHSRAQRVVIAWK